MASKGQKFNKYTKGFKEELLKEYFNGEGGYTSLSKKYNISINTIYTWVDTVRYPQKHLGTGQKKGRPKDSGTDWKEKYEILKKYQAFLKAQQERK